MRFLLGLLLLILLPKGSLGQEQIPISPAAARANVDSISHVYYEARFAMYPAYATSMGVVAYDSLLSTFAPRKVRRFIIQTKRMRQDLMSFTEDSLDIQTWIDMKALVADMSTQLFLLEDLKMPTKSPILYVDGCTNGLYYLAIRDQRFWLDPSFRARLAHLPKTLEMARKNLTDPIRLHCEVASASAKAFLPFLLDLESRPEEGSPGGAGLDPALIDRAYQSLQQFAAYLDSLSVTANPDFALGYDNFVRLLTDEHLIYEPPEEILAYAERVLKDTKDRLNGLPKSGREAKVDTAYASRLTMSDILAFYGTEADSALAFLTRKDIVTIPQGASVAVVETPAFIRVMAPGYAYEPPGPFDTNQRGLLYVPLPDSLSVEEKIYYAIAAGEGKFKGLMVHELYPGHHLQVVIANRGQSFVRKLQQDNFMMEGWALYCEEMMAGEGYYGADGMRRALGGIRLRAARAVIDIKLQLKQFSLDQAVDFMVRETGQDRAFAEQEVRSYAVDPTQPMSYLVGKRDIVALKDEVRRLRGSNFSLKEFHDMLLSCGSLPPSLLRVCVMSRATGKE